MQDFNLLYPLSYVLILLGLIGAVVPILPGSLLIWLGAYAWANANGFHAFGWPTLVVLGILMVITWVTDGLLTILITRKAGGSRWAIVGEIIGGVLGGLLLTAPFPIVGTILGGIAGSIIGILVVELLAQRNLRVAFKAAIYYIFSYLASAALKLFLCLVMIAIFLVRAFVL